MKPALFSKLRDAIQNGELVTVVTVVSGGGEGNQLLVRPSVSSGDLGSAALNAKARELAAETFATFGARRASVEIDGDSFDLFLDVHPPPPKLIIIGAVHVAIHLIHFAKRLGFRTIVIDPRSAFATAERFAHADQLLVEWPKEALAKVRLDEATYLAVLSHDLKIDVPALVEVLASPARYIGALGSKKTQHKREAALREAGVSEAQLERIRGPIGLDLGGRRAEEIALAVIGEIVAVSHGRA